MGQILKVGAALLALPVMGWVALHPVTEPVSAAPAQADAATVKYYVGKCKMCHGDKAQKAWDPSKYTDEQMIEAIMKGKKAAKPPHMPGFAAKGLTTEQATALLAYMKSLRPAATP